MKPALGAGEERDQLGHLLRAADAAERVHCAPCRDQRPSAASPLRSSAAQRSIGVSTEPGQTALTRMLSAAWSSAIARVSAISAPLLAV